MSLKAIAARGILPTGPHATELLPRPAARVRPPALAASPRILMVVESAAGGTGRHVLDLSEGLIAQGCDVHLAYSAGRIDRMFRDRLAGVRGLTAVEVPMRTSIHPSDARAVATVRDYIRTRGPFDVVHGHSSKGGAIARLAALGTGARAYYTLHGFIIMDPGLALWKRGIYLTIEVALGLATSRIIAVSPEEGRAAVRLGLGRSRVAVVPNGLGPIELAPREDARRELGVPGGATVVGFVGRLVDQKAPDVLLRGFARASREVPDADLRLAMIGSGPLEEGLRRLSASLGVADRVLWLGERDARGLLAAFDLFALSSRKEGLPYVVLEAMAAGLPVVATVTAGVEALIEPGVTGVVVPPDDPSSFGRALASVAGDRERLGRLGEAARARSRLFSIQAMVGRTLALYRGEGHETAPPSSELASAPSQPSPRPALEAFPTGEGDRVVVAEDAGRIPTPTA